MTRSRQTLKDWIIRRIGGKKAQVIGHVSAPDASAAVRRAIVELNVRAADQARLIAAEVDLGGEDQKLTRGALTKKHTT